MIRSFVRAFDQKLARVLLKLGREKASLISFLFHGLFLDEQEAQSGDVDPQQAFTLEHFKRFVAYYSTRGFRFVSPTDLISGSLDPEVNHVLITFDDGYECSRRGLPILEEFGAPAVFFISTDNVLNGRAFWWDVVYRERLRQGRPQKEISREQQALKSKRHDEIEAYLVDNFGSRATQPVGDSDRPMTPDELKHLADHPLAHIGNHTRHHAILTNYAEEGIESEIRGAQDDFRTLIGHAPNFVSYPNGNFSPQIVNVAQNTPGLWLGITTIHLKNRLPLSRDKRSLFLLNRFMLWGNDRIEEQCLCCRSDFGLTGRLQRYRRYFGGLR
jgi:peptidoglycan/xylan/chitin deacetylase (PgdA/CDA1 family)